jgi:hypothetical protein
MAETNAREGSAIEERLHVLFELGPFVGAVPVLAVDRLVLAEEVEADPFDAQGMAAVRLGGMVYAGWDINALLRTSAASKSWLILRWTSDGATRPPVALAVGACIAVRTVPEHAPLPRGIFQSRSRAIAGCFQVDAAQSIRATTGLVIDVHSLWSAAELAAASTLLARRRP